jgi:hypothetical protein
MGVTHVKVDGCEVEVRGRPSMGNTIHRPEDYCLVTPTRQSTCDYSQNRKKGVVVILYMCVVEK